VPSSIIHVAVRLTFTSAEPGKQEWHLFQKESHTIVSVTIASPDYPSELTSHSHTSSTHSIAAQEAVKTFSATLSGSPLPEWLRVTRAIRLIRDFQRHSSKMNTILSISLCDITIPRCAFYHNAKLPRILQILPHRRNATHPLHKCQPYS